jgi:dihydrodipicolinate synthase/N-acetylneuraminate lyase
VSQTENLQGILPAAVTPFDAHERFAPAPFEALLESLYAAGVHGVYVCGGTGEGLLQTVEQRKLVAEAAVRNSPKGKLVIVHVGSHRTADAIELAEHAGRIGANAVSALPPPGNYGFAEIRAYYEAIAAAASAPLLVYFFPGNYPGVHTLDQVLDLCTIPNVAGLKYTDFDLYRLANTMPVLAQVARPEIRATGYGIFNLVGCVAGGAMAAAAGALKPVIGLSEAIEISGLLLLVAAVALLVVSRAVVRAGDSGAGIG